MKLSLRTQAVIGIGLIEIVMLMILLYSVFQFITRSTSEEVERRAESIARVFAATAADDVLSLDLGALQSFVDAAARTPGTAFARVVDYQGHLLAEAGNSEALLKPFRESKNLESLPDLYMAKAAIVKAGLNYGRIEIGLDLREQKQGIAALRDRSLLIATIEVLLAAIFSIAAGYYLVRRLNHMRQVVELVGSGEVRTRIQDPMSDEVADLAHEIDRLVEQTSWERDRQNERLQELEELNQSLHRKISELQRRL